MPFTSYQAEIIVVLASFVVVWITLSLFYSEKRLCTVIVTGESVKIIDCEFTVQFIEYAKSLKAFNHDESN
uniref:Movement protein TGBp3 n=1 Tax=Peony betaflexivirus 1 TaxID=2800951 RepID=A0A7L7QV02_9VIRU|nr:TGB3 [Peony betaflexivirus 1]